MAEISDGKAAGLLTWIALAIFSAVLVVVLVFSEPAHSVLCALSEENSRSCLRDFLSEFQTLITGLAAVIAASVTIYFMHRTDAAQEARHRELVQLTLRSDRLSLERALVPQAAELQRIQMGIDFGISRATNRRLGEDFREGAAELAGNLSLALTLCEKVINRQAFVDGSKLFDGRLAASIDHFRKALESRRNRSRDAIGPLNFGRSDAEAPVWSEAKIDTLALKIIRDSSEISNELDSIIKGFRRLSRAYDVQIEIASSS